MGLSSERVYQRKRKQVRKKVRLGRQKKKKDKVNVCVDRKTMRLEKRFEENNAHVSRRKEEFNWRYLI